ncbi:MAG TPA: 3D-(3,5/4)-trihydroxycyclohexane-1,2-dione acylhydrolase (decyclizing), partial [Chloroflexota bacterium]|nr:3D-(3,5/4)-trihydroxycyclohexane-1,2-dione acylhydrolase (decyclizing) [Chloroflexota bacterium]
MKTQRMTVGQAIVRFLAQQYVERDGREHRLIAGMWGIFGHGNVAGLGQALEELADETGLRYYRPQNEQAMVHLAAAYAKTCSRLSTFACTSSIGPGATNMVTAAAGATINRLPVVLFPSDYFANRFPDPVLQQLEHPRERDVSVNDAFRPVSAFFDRVSRPEQLIGSLVEGFRVLTDPAETGAVTISLPEDVQTEAYDFPAGLFERRVWHVRRPPPEPALLRRAAALVRGSRRPLMVVGGGAIYAGATDELRAFVERTGVPICETQAGKGALPWNHPMNAGPVGANGGLAANRLARDADLVIALGTRLGDFATASKSAFRNPDLRVIGVNVAPMDAGKLDGLALVADAKVALQELAAALEGWRTADDYQAEVERLKAEWDAAVDKLRAPDDGPLSQAQAIALVNEAAGPRGTVVCAAGSMPGDLLKLWRTEDPKGYHLEYGYSCMGYEIPGGLGIRMAEPERPVFVMIGDGTYLLMNSEIVTAVQEGLKITIVVVDNHGFQSIHGLQRSVGSPSFGNELRFRAGERLSGAYVPVDFAKHAEAMGARAFRACTYGELRDALAQAAGSDRVSVVVAEVDPERRVPAFEGWWDVPVAEVSGEESVQRAR